MRGTGSDDWAAFCNDPGASRVWLVEIEAFPLAAPTGNAGTLGEPAFGELALGETGASVSAVALGALRVSSHGYTAPEYDPSSYHYAPRVQAVRVDARLPGPLFAGAAQVFAEVDLDNADGLFDTLMESYAIDGRVARIMVGRPTWPPPGAAAATDMMTVFTGTVRTVEIQLQRVRLTLDSPLRKLDIPIQDTLYAAGEGGGALSGLPKPLTFGRAYNVAPVMIDPVSLVYQVHDGEILDVTGVYDRGVPLTRTSAAPGLGEYLVNLANGTLQLGGAPDGEVTADVIGCATTWPFVFSVALQRTNSGLSVTLDDYFALSSLLPGEGGWHVGAAPAIAGAVLDAMAASVGAFFHCDYLGNLRAQHLGIAQSPAVTLNATDILELERVRFDDSVEPAVYRVSSGYARNWTVQSDLADAVESSRIAQVSVPEQVVVNEDGSTRSRHPLAKALHLSSMLSGADGALSLARLMQTLWGVPRARLRLRAGMPALLLELGDAVTVQIDRFGLSDGATARVVGWSVDTANPGIELDLVTVDPALLTYRAPGPLDPIII